MDRSSLFVIRALIYEQRESDPILRNIFDCLGCIGGQDDSVRHRILPPIGLKVLSHHRPGSVA